MAEAQPGARPAGRFRWLSLLGLEAPLQRLRDTVTEAALAAEDRVELLSIEWAEEKQRLRRLLVLAVAAAALTVVLFIVLSAAVLVQFWDTPWRLGAAWGVAAAWALAWAWVLVALVRVARQGQQSFALTRRELGRDWADLKEGL
ncbi:phage holin family protein [Curvibacter lanceolatus]|uniref:phage holin family protein n=1 Tax=Curvibacter lanceolatus TaxID=86182 RepID=UPI0006844B4E|nr:phage holin family protein [Curvibacter lanceolatus]